MAQSVHGFLAVDEYFRPGSVCATIATQCKFSQRDVHFNVTSNLFTNFELLILNEP